MREFIESDLDLHQDLESLRKLVPRFEMPSPSQSRKREYVNLDIDIQIIGVYAICNSGQKYADFGFEV